eukprot:3272932-Rhodomonas_salina.1
MGLLFCFEFDRSDPTQVYRFTAEMADEEWWYKNKEGEKTGFSCPPHALAARCPALTEMCLLLPGPADLDLLEALWLAGDMDGLTMVWKEGMNDFVPLGEVPELRARLAQAGDDEDDVIEEEGEEPDGSSSVQTGNGAAAAAGASAAAAGDGATAEAAAGTAAGAAAEAAAGAGAGAAG